MCSTHSNRQDGGCGPRGARVCKGGNVLKVTWMGQSNTIQNHRIGYLENISKILRSPLTLTSSFYVQYLKVELLFICHDKYLDVIVLHIVAL